MDSSNPADAPDDRETLVSVRSEAETTVDPDSGTLYGQITLTRAEKAGALHAAAVAVDALKDALERLGGVPLSAATVRNPLTWSTQRVNTYPELDQRRQGSTGRVTASTTIVIAVRDMSLLGNLEQLLAGIASFQLSQAGWQVDSDNPAWTGVRADAIREALRKGQDYAAALHASLVGVVHVADVGLLGSGDDGAPSRPTPRVMAAAMGGAGATPSLDPVPQTLVAQIEARLRITPVTLPPGH